MQNLYSTTHAETVFRAGNAGLSTSRFMNETDLEKELLSSPYDDEEEEDDDDDDDEDDDDEDDDGEIDDELEDIDVDVEEEDDLDSLDDDEEETETEEDLASSSPVPASAETGARPPGTERPAEKGAVATNGLTFNCYICEEPSSELCARCTRDTCDNHICERCLLCSDCCTCDLNPR